jgi:hypothetical protein
MIGGRGAMGECVYLPVPGGADSSDFTSAVGGGL